MSMDICRDEVARLQRVEDAQLVEVLPPPEYDWAHLPGAVNLPLKKLDADTASVLALGGQSSRTATTSNET